ncbi:hypothetical protein [Paenibacillus lentus]|uniref:Uncharacterized protein n=1 Tax=Paenibacillus lentus TaxID=1338368 RepID=A0A3Q8S4N4_9BACL|nr:hypothetical protein [Paenibacillus lentus]AZK46461.1 hypothetical protein EIM92_09990 [Paenibacillus lentus]
MEHEYPFWDVLVLSIGRVFKIFIDNNQEVTAKKKQPMILRRDDGQMVILIFIGGAIGALSGILTTAANVSVFRLSAHIVVRIILTLLINLAGTGLLLFLASTLNVLLR